MKIKDEAMAESFEAVNDVYYDLNNDVQAAKEWLRYVLEEVDAEEKYIAFFMLCVDIIDELINKKADSKGGESVKEIHVAFPPKFHHMKYIIINDEKYINSAYTETSNTPTDRSEALTTKEANT